MNRKLLIASTIAAVVLMAGSNAGAGLIWIWNDGSGLSARTEFSLLSPTVLQVTAVNTSTAMPPSLAGDTSNQFLTSISFDLGNGVEITGGSVILGPGAWTVNFDNVPAQLTAGADVSAEWGFGNDGQTISLGRNFVTAMQSHATRFTSSGNLDGPANLSGPQGGLLANPVLMDPGGLGGIQGAVVFTLQLSGPITLDNLCLSSGAVEFGSDAAFIRNSTPVPEPVTMVLMMVGGAAFALATLRKRRSLRLASPLK